MVAKCSLIGLGYQLTPRNQHSESAITVTVRSKSRVNFEITTMIYNNNTIFIEGTHNPEDNCVDLK